MVLLVSGCEGDDPTASTAPAITAPGGEDAYLPNLPEPQRDDDNRLPRASSVGDGDIRTPAPPIAPVVREAAAAAGCQADSFPSEGREHVAPEDAPQYNTRPATSGNHHAIPAKYGVYDLPVPDMPIVHTLEHGGVVIYIGPDVPAAERAAIGRFWAQSPPYMVVASGSSADFPARGVVVTSWQRWLVCKPFTEAHLAAVKAFRDEYRGTGPEAQPAAHGTGSVDFPDMPEPLVLDPGA
jgi:Protein of unknown function (DUF3105)